MKLRKLDSLIIWTLVGLALILRLPLLGDSFWLDEAAQALEVVRPWHQQLLIAPDFQPPLLHLILHLAQYLSTGEVWLRLVGAVIPGLMSIYFALKLAQRYLNTNQVIWLGLLLATSQLHVFFSQELRPYALPAALASLAWWWLDRIISAKPDKGGRALPGSASPANLIGFGIVAGLGLYSSYLYPFVIIAQLGYIIWQRRLSLVWPSFGLGGLMFAPWLPWFFEQLSVGTTLRAALPGWDQVVSTPQLKALLLVPGKFLFGQVPLDPLASGVTLVVAGLIAGLIMTQFALKHPLQMILRTKIWPFIEKFLGTKSDQRQLWLLSLIWLIVPFLTAWLISWWVPVVSPKRLLFSLPAFYLVLISWNYLRAKRWLWHWVLATMLIINVIGLTNYWSQPLLQREDWRSLVSEIHSDYSADTTLVVFGFEAPFSPWAWYEQDQTKPLPTLSTGYLTTPADQVQIKTLLAPAENYRYVLVFDYLRDLTDPENLIPTTLEAMGFQEVGVYDSPNIGFVRIFSTQSARIGTL